MARKISLKHAFNTWERHHIEKDSHISLERFYELSLDGGIKQAKPEDIHHLSLCPVCLEVWEAMTSSETSEKADDYDETEEIDMAIGFLEAAATDVATPLYIKSSCSRFMLGIFPEVDNSLKGMVVIETIPEQKKFYEGGMVIVKDANGQNILKARIKNGRAAGKAENLEVFDLSKWTVVFTKFKG